MRAWVPYVEPEGAMILNLLYWGAQGYVKIFFLSQHNNWMHQTSKKWAVTNQSLCYQPISLFLKVYSFRLIFFLAAYTSFN